MDDFIAIQNQLNILLDESKFLAIGEQNPKIKQVKGLITNSKPNPEKLFIAEGIWIQKKLIEFKSDIKSLIICPECIYTFEALGIVKQLIKQTTEYYSVSKKTFLKLSERDKPDGLLCIAALPKHNIDTFTFDANSIILVLDGIEIPGNIGTMLRMSDGAGIDAVFICNRKARLSHPKLIKGSMGAVLTVPIFEFEDIESCKLWLRKNHFNIYLADTRAKKHYFEEPFNCNTALVMGSERYGISKDWYDSDITMISIPMLGKCDSLNVGVAATVLAYEASIKNKLGATRK